MSVTISTLMRGQDGCLSDYATGVVRDHHYLEGAILLDCHGVRILDERMVDLVDQLWAYLIAGCEELQRGRDFATYFPDQPLELTIRHVGGRGELLITTSVDAAKKAVVQQDEFFAGVSTQGRAYLSWLERNAPGGSEYRSLVERAARLHPANAARR